MEEGLAQSRKVSRIKNSNPILPLRLCALREELFIFPLSCVNPVDSRFLDCRVMIFDFPGQGVPTYLSFLRLALRK